MLGYWNINGLVIKEMLPGTRASGFIYRVELGIKKGQLSVSIM